MSLHRASKAAGTSQPLGWRFYLPEGWAQDPVRRQRAGVPPEAAHQSRLNLALSLIDQGLGWRLPPGTVLADEAYGGSFEWRAALRQRGFSYGVRVPWTTTGWREAPRFGPPAAPGRGRPARCGPLLGPEPRNLLAIARGLPACAWKQVAWRQGSKGPQSSRFATFGLWAANGWKQGPQLERVEETALIEWPVGEPAPARCWLVRLPRRLALPKLAATAKARWRIEQDYRELKDELGLDHFEGRSWRGYHHLALVTAAFVFLRREQARLRRRTKKACPRPRCRRCAAPCKPPSSA